MGADGLEGGGAATCVENVAENLTPIPGRTLARGAAEAGQEARLLGQGDEGREALVAEEDRVEQARQARNRPPLRALAIARMQGGGGGGGKHRHAPSGWLLSW